METEINTPFTFYTDRVRKPEVKDLDTSSPTVYTKQFDDTYSEHAAIYFRTTPQVNALKAMVQTPPKTVGELWMRYLEMLRDYSRTSSQLSALENGMTTIAAKMNEYADDQDWCNEYEYQLNEFNGALSNAGYSGWFSFEGRTQQMRVRVERVREVKEHVWIEMEVPKGDDPDYYYATELAGEMEVDEWNIDDDHYNDGNYEVTDTETI